MKSLIILFVICVSFNIHGQEYHFSLSSLGEDRLYNDPPDEYSLLEGGIILKGSGLYGEELWRYGWFLDYIPSNFLYRYDIDQSMITIGGTFGAAFDVSEAIQLQALAEVGYRHTNVSGDRDPYNGFALNLNLNGVYWLDGDIHPKLNLGFISQPDGGNSDRFISFGPQWYIGVGAIYLVD